MSEETSKIREELKSLKTKLANINIQSDIVKSKISKYSSILSDKLDSECEHENILSVPDPQAGHNIFNLKIHYCKDCGYRINKSGICNSIRLPLEEIPSNRDSDRRKDIQETIDMVKSGGIKDKMNSLANTTSHAYPFDYQYKRSQNPITDAINQKCRHVNKLIKKGGNPYRLNGGDPLYCGDCGYKITNIGGSWGVYELITPPENEKLEIWKDGK